jgi:RNA polymerase sigma-70 factor (ECF subfamily)
VLLNKWRDRQRRRAPAAAGGSQGGLSQVEDSVDPDSLSEVEYRQHLVARALELMQTEFSPNTWKACWEHVVNSRPAAEVAAELGISAGSVYVAKSRVLSRLRQELDGLLDE